MVGEETILATCFFPKPKLLSIGSIFIGDESLVGGLSKIGPNVRIGNKVSIQANVNVFPKVLIEDKVKVGASSTIETGCILRKKVRIGKYCHILKGIEIPEDTIIPNFTKISKQEDLLSFLSSQTSYKNPLKDRLADLQP